MSIQGLADITAAELEIELQRGARFVVFPYAVSVVLLTFRHASDVHFIRAGEGTFRKSFPFTMLSLAFGWWGIPWGPIWTISALVTTLRGGKDVTDQILAAMRSAA